MNNNSHVTVVTVVFLIETTANKYFEYENTESHSQVHIRERPSPSFSTLISINWAHEMFISFVWEAQRTASLVDLASFNSANTDSSANKSEVSYFFFLLEAP